MKSDRLTRWLYPLLGLLLLVFSVCILSQELSRYQLGDILHSLSTIGDRQLRDAFSFALLGYLVISSYDLIAFRHLNHYLDRKRILFATFVTYAISNTTGFTLFIGGGIRYRFYSWWGVPARIIARITVLGNLTFWLGLLSLSGITFLINPLHLPPPINIKLAVIRYLGLAALITVGTYLYYGWRCKRWKIQGQIFNLPQPATSLAQITVFALDWGLAAAVLYCLLPDYPHKSYWEFSNIYLFSMAASIISNVPGGIGVFETVVIFLLPRNMSTPDVLSSLLVYRAIRFLLPLGIALILIVCYEIRRKLKGIKRQK